MKHLTPLSTLLLLLLLPLLPSCQPSDPGAQATLPHFQQRRLAALQALEATPADQVQTVHLAVSTTAEHRSGVRRIRLRGHQIISDSDYTFAGYDLGPGSPESSLTAIASDLADTYLSQAALQGVPIDSLSISITSRRDTVRPAVRIVHPHNLHYTLYIQSSATDEQLETIRLLAEQHSPAFNIAAEKQVVQGHIDYAPTPRHLTITPPYQPGLREYLHYKRAALLARSNRPPAAANPPADEQLEPKYEPLYVEIDPASGARKVHIRHFRFIHDNQALFAGNDLGPSSLEHQLGALTSCITHITEIQAASRQIALDTLYVTAHAEYDPRAGRPGFETLLKQPYTVHYTVHYRSPHTYDEIVALRDAVENVCPIYNLFISEQKIEGRIVRKNPEHAFTHTSHEQKK
jgi:uncharacterized OsmC-like protein